MEIKKIQDVKPQPKSELPVEKLKDKDMSSVRGGAKVHVCG